MISSNTISPDETIPGRAEGEPGPLVLVLIQVPDASGFRPRPIRAESWLDDFGGRRLAAPRRSRRRRLRRELRVTAYACLATLPLIVGAGVWSIHSTARRAGAAEVDPPPRAVGHDQPGPARPLVWLSVESAETSLEAVPETPVVFPGYLVPTERREEPSHEGS